MITKKVKNSNESVSSVEGVRSANIMVSERSIMYCVAGQLYDQAPNRQPRKANDIMMKVRDYIRNHPDCYNDNEYRTIRVQESELYDFVKDMLMSIPEFKELNVSQKEYDAGITEAEEDSFKFVSRYDVYDEESWYTDFIDLDAFIRNVVDGIYRDNDSYTDCFLCINQPLNVQSTLASGNNEKCKTCYVNPDFSNNYECRREPKGDCKTVCKFDCYASKYICCEECPNAGKCTKVCTGKSSTCGNLLTDLRE